MALSEDGGRDDREKRRNRNNIDESAMTQWTWRRARAAIAERVQGQTPGQTPEQAINIGTAIRIKTGVSDLS